MLSLAAPIALMILLIMPDGTTYQRHIEYKTLDLCFEAAYEFMKHPPGDFGAIALGAGCVVYPGVRPS